MHAAVCHLLIDEMKIPSATALTTIGASTSHLVICSRPSNMRRNVLRSVCAPATLLCAPPSLMTHVDLLARYRALRLDPVEAVVGKRTRLHAPGPLRPSKSRALQLLPVKHAEDGAHAFDRVSHHSHDSNTYCTYGREKITDVATLSFR